MFNGYKADAVELQAEALVGTGSRVEHHKAELMGSRLRELYLFVQCTSIDTRQL